MRTPTTTEVLPALPPSSPLMSSYQQLTSHARNPLRSTLEEQRSKQDYYSRKTVQNLIAAGLVEPDSGRNSSNKRPSKAGGSLKGFSISLKDHSTCLAS